jgi:ribose transport system substrate-binding protein
MKRSALIISILAAALGLVSCGGGKTAAKAPKASAGDELYIEVSCLWNLEYFNDHKLGMKLAGDYLGVKTETIGPAEWDVAGMVTAMEQAIAKKPAGIVVCAMDPALNPAIKQAMDAGIPVVTVDADQPESGRMAFVGTGNYAAGYLGGQKLASLIGGKGTVAVMTMPTQTNHQERLRGYKDALVKTPDIKIVQVVDTGADAVKSAQVASTLLQKFPNLAAIVCTDSTGGAGAATAVKEAGKAGVVKIMAMDRGSEILQAIKDGTISASLVQQTVLMPFYAVSMMHNLKLGNFPVSNDNKAAGVSGAPVSIDTGTVVVDASNVDKFLK